MATFNSVGMGSALCQSGSDCAIREQVVGQASSLFRTARIPGALSTRTFYRFFRLLLGGTHDSPSLEPQGCFLVRGDFAHRIPIQRVDIVAIYGAWSFCTNLTSTEDLIPIFTRKRLLASCSLTPAEA